ncbi:MAG: tautomerase family protein [Ruminiclostridium sp.]|nr:tautomerase family protein [Ruminiclostridium sp.]
MPHVSVKCYPGRTEEQKRLLAEKITSDVIEIFGAAEETVSVSIRDIDPEKWESEIVGKEILPEKEYLYKKPGYMK